MSVDAIEDLAMKRIDVQIRFVLTTEEYHALSEAAAPEGISPDELAKRKVREATINMFSIGELAAEEVAHKYLWEWAEEVASGGLEAEERSLLHTICSISVQSHDGWVKHNDLMEPFSDAGRQYTLARRALRRMCALGILASRGASPKNRSYQPNVHFFEDLRRRLRPTC